MRPRHSDERDLSWFDFPTPRDLSLDGSTLLFDEQGEGGGRNYGVFVRRTDGAPAVRIGDGAASRFSPDLQSALTRAPSDPRNIWTIIPIGLGEPRKIVMPLPAIWPSDPAGVRTTFGPPIVSADGRAYAYSYRYLLSDLFVGDRLQ